MLWRHQPVGKDDVVVITGAGSGIGAGLARALCHRGCKVHALDSSTDRLDKLRSEVAPDGDLTVAAMDVSDSQALQRYAARCNSVDVLIACAGVAAAAPFQRLPVEDLRWVMEVNFWGFVNCCTAFQAALSKSSKARIVAMLSPFALIGFPTKSAYCASKFALRGFTESLRADLARSDIEVTSVYLGPVSTALVRDSRSWDASAKMAEAQFMERQGLPLEKVVRQILKGIDHGRQRIVVGGLVRSVDFLARVYPTGVNRALSKWQARIPFLKGAAL